MTQQHGGRHSRQKASPPHPVLQVEPAEIDSLQPWEGNPRDMAAQEMKTLQDSITHFGLVQPVLARRCDRRIIAGHQRVSAARASGETTVPVIFLDDLSDEEATTLSIALNKISGDWDAEKLGRVLEEVLSWTDFDPTRTGFQEAEIDTLLATLERESAPGPREASFGAAAEGLQRWADEHSPTRVRAGDLWQLGQHRLLCGDSNAPGSLARLTEGRPVDVTLTDPPYGISYRSTQPARGKRKRALANDGVAEYEAFLSRSLPMVKSVMKPGATLLWFAGGGGPEPVLAKALLAIAEHFTLLNTIVWDRMDVGLGWRWRSRWEAIIEASVGKPAVWHGGTDRANVLRYPHAVPGADDHPTPKPTPLLSELIRCCAPAHGVVLDPFCGSGSTLIAAEETGRVCLAGELDPRYADMIVTRWEAATGETAVCLGRE